MLRARFETDLLVQGIDDSGRVLFVPWVPTIDFLSKLHCLGLLLLRPCELGKDLQISAEGIVTCCDYHGMYDSKQQRRGDPIR